MERGLQASEHYAQKKRGKIEREREKGGEEQRGEQAREQIAWNENGSARKATKGESKTNQRKAQFKTSKADRKESAIGLRATQEEIAKPVKRVCSADVVLMMRRFACIAGRVSLGPRGPPGRPRAQGRGGTE